VPINGGEARKLTSHIGNEIFPHFSPDGKTIAFTGQYDGNTEVYTIPSDGGEPLRITYTPTNSRDDLGDRMGPNNIVTNWTPDGKNIVYRNRIGDGFVGKLYTVDKEGGLSQEIPLPEGGFCSYSPDGKKMAYNRTMREFRTWKHYKGGMADEIWIYDPEKKSVSNITDNPAQDIFPMWIGDEIYFLSDRDKVMNLFVYDTKSKQTSKVTNFNEYDIKFPTAHGKTIVFENGGYIYTLDADTKKANKVNITLQSDNNQARKEIKDAAPYVRSISASPSGERVVVTARGELYDVPVKEGVTRNITQSPGAHDREARWSPDGKSIAFISDGTGETEIYLYDVENNSTSQLTKNNDTYIRELSWSPDSKYIVYTDRKNRINLLNVAAKSSKNILTEPLQEFRGVKFSADSKWITYTRPAANDHSVIYIYNISSGKEYAITDKWYDSGNPTFSTDGKYLIFTSSRDFNPTYGALEWNHTYNNMGGLYIALLDEATPSPFLGKDGEAVTVTTDDAKESKDSKDSKESTDVKFTPEGITDRILRVPVGTGYFHSLYSDGKNLYYGINGSTKKYNLADRKESVVADGATMSIEPGAQKAVFRKGGNVYVADIPNGNADLSSPINLNNMKATIDYPQEWAQIFDEAWRAYRDGFYLSNMHGFDWKKIKERYAQLLPYVKSRLDLNYIIGEMIGELECGHAYVNPGEYPKAEKINMGLLGADVSRDKGGFFKIEKIIPGASWSDKLRSPLTEPGIDAKEGYYIVAIDGIPTNTVKDMYSLLVGKANTPTEIRLNSKPQLEGANKVVIKPIEEEYSIRHYNWVQGNIKKVEEASGGKIGYIYIPDMGVEGLNEFARYFYPQLDKEGLIIDDRENGGGNVSPMILERLSREPYRLTMSRTSSRVGTVPDAVQVGPKVCLINKYSASDGDLFPWGFRALGLGKLIGTRTWGGIIGISGSLPYMDGTDIRVPFFTSFDAKTGDWIIENHGVDPDIVIDNDPIKEYAGEDQQLDKAIEEVMKELKDRKPLPKTPAPRNWNK
jgi:tricorn protease